MGIFQSTYEQNDFCKKNCPWCGSTNTTYLDGYTTQVGYGSFYDNMGKTHYHDGNICKHTHKCLNWYCRHQWTDYEPSTCWCGWIQYTPLSGYQGQHYNKNPLNETNDNSNYKHSAHEIH